MAEYRLRATGEVMQEGELRAYLLANNGPSFGRLTAEVMEKIGVDPVFDGARPTPTSVYEYPVRQGVEQGPDGKWYSKYILAPVFAPAPDAAAQEAAYRARRDVEQSVEIRAERNRLLAECDWTQLADVPLAKADWLTYRQALRDLPAQAGFPWQVTWPVAPALKKQAG
jgi:hypothetical protein